MSENNSMNVVLVAALAFTAGAVTALLLAPGSGDETRRKLARIAKEAGESAGKIAHDTAESAGKIANDAGDSAGRIAQDAGVRAGKFIQEVGGKAREGMDIARTRLGEGHSKVDGMQAEIARSIK